jgi:hypothetical protein
MSNDDLGFTFRQANGDYVIFHHGKKATILRGQTAAAFESDVGNADFSEQQQLMARLTGNYRRGNERVARNHPRNRR